MTTIASAGTVPALGGGPPSLTPERVRGLLGRVAVAPGGPTATTLAPFSGASIAAVP
ncbi:MAG: hypothetical protein JWL95_413, partial [Gemmatimonadetes bacterium]|nr:hypothetical protein [Gemmatimonadota bacterium]